MDIHNQFESFLQSRGLAQNTIRNYITTLCRFTRWIELVYSEFDPGTVTALDIADYRRYLIEQNKKPATVNHALDVLNSFFTWANTKKIIQTNPVTGIKRAKEQKNAPRWLDRRELNHFMRVVQKYGNQRDTVLVMLLLHTGIRIFEAVSMRIEDVVIRERSGLIKVQNAKGGKYREVPLNITIRRVLENYINELPSGWLFPGRKSHITTRAAEQALAKYAKISGVDVTPHMLRHTFGKKLVDAGESLDRVAALMGHSNLNTTARYTRPSVQDLERAVEKLAWE